MRPFFEALTERVSREIWPSIVCSVERRHSGRNLPVNRYVGDAHLLHRRDQRAGLAGVAVQKAFPLQRVDVLHHRSLAGEAEMMLDFARARGDAFFALLGLDEFQDALAVVP